MDTLQKHELFEMDVLEKLKSAKLLDALVFGGGTMLRLCYELNRYSVDLDFWFAKKVPHKTFFEKMKKALGGSYEITDAAEKFHTLLFELRSPGYPRRLKLEIRKEMKDCETEDRIAFSRFGQKQVIARVHTLQQMMRNKVAAAIDRREPRDLFDIEFLLRRGAALPPDKNSLDRLAGSVSGISRMDILDALGPMLEPADRSYYSHNGFAYLSSKLKAIGP